MIPATAVAARPERAVVKAGNSGSENNRSIYG